MEVQTFINWFLFFLGLFLGYYLNTFTNFIDKTNKKYGDINGRIKNIRYNT
jgi:hypothetical protein